MDKTINEELLTFIKDHPSVYHVIEGQKRLLEEAGYKELKESEKWEIAGGGRYFVTRGGSSIAAFRIPKGEPDGFMILASHSDSPSFKVKENPVMTADGFYKKLNVEAYGGALYGPWFDRPLSVAGRVFLRTERGAAQKLVSIDRDLLMIPSLAIHMDRQANKGVELKVQRDLLPLYGTTGDPDLMELLSVENGFDAGDVLSSDLYLVNCQEPAIWGAGGEFISSPRLDDLQCAYASLRGFLMSEDCREIALHVVFNNEEVGSLTRQGADSDFLEETVRRIAGALKVSENTFGTMLTNSFMLSADNAHGYHPNHPEKCDPVNHPKMGKGVVLKFSGNQKYATDAESAAVTYLLAEKAGVPVQVFTNHSDIPGGSTLGNISGRHLSVKTADIGLAQLAMHSPYETASAADTEAMVALANALFTSGMKVTGDGAFELI